MILAVLSCIFFYLLLKSKAILTTVYSSFTFKQNLSTCLLTELFEMAVKHAALVHIGLVIEVTDI